MCYAYIYGRPLNGDLSSIKKTATRIANQNCRSSDTLKVYDRKYPMGSIQYVFVRKNQIYGEYFKPGKWETVYDRNNLAKPINQISAERK